MNKPTTFHLTQLAEGISTAISIPGMGAWGNAGIVDLGERTLIFDTFFTPQAAQELREAAEHLTGRAPAYVINSHWHTDHVLGNQVFPEATIIATAPTREWMARDIQNLQQTPAELQEAELLLAQEEHEQIRHALSTLVADLRQLVLALPNLHMILPQQTFTEKLTLYGSQRRVEILTSGGGHTASDAFLYLPDERLLFTGDLLAIQTHPSMWRGDPEKWLSILTEIQTLNVQTVVPGHGPVGRREHLATMHDYLNMMLEWARLVVKQEQSLAQAEANFLSAPFETWEAAHNITPNLKFLMNYVEQHIHQIN